MQPIYASTDLETPPRLASASVTAKVVQDSYPDGLRRAHIGGVVQLQFIVDANGKVEEPSIEVVESSSEGLTEAARRAAARIEFKPGIYKGQPVRTRVLLPIVYRAAR